MRQLNENSDYVVTFEPIDGGTIIDANYSVASIFSIWGTDKIVGSTGRDLIGAALAIYGSRTTILTFNAHNKQVEELTLLKIGNKYRWVVTHPKLEVLSKATSFSPEGVKACYDNPAYLKLIQYYCVQGHSIRYSSAISNDIYQMFIKKGGIYTSLESLAFGLKLKLVFECIPLAFLLEHAKAVSTNGKEALLDVKITSYDQKTQFIAGSKEEVKFVLKTLECDGENLKSLDEEAKALLESLKL